MKELLSLIDNIEGGILSALVLLIGLFMFIYKEAVSTWIKNFKFKRFKYDIKDLVLHDLFFELERRKGYTKEFRSYHKLDETKTKVFKDFIDIKLDNTSISLKQIVEEYKKGMSKAELKSLVFSKFDECNKCLENRLIKRFTEGGLTLEVSRTIVDKFFEIRTNTLNVYEERIESVFACDFYESNFQLILAVYELVTFEIDGIIKETVKAFELVNGLFFELDYK